MSIVAYTGLPGSGKSYGVVDSVILPMLKQGRTIVTNIPLKRGRIADDYPDGKVIAFDSSVENDFFSSHKMIAGAVYVIDEAWRWFPSGIRANQVPTEEKQFFTEHRHFVGDDGFTCEIVLVTQNLNQIATFVKSLVEETYISCKLSSLGQKNKFRIDVYNGVAEGVKPRGDVVRQLFGTYKQDVFQYYSSHTQNKTSYTTGQEQKVTDRTNVLKSWKFRIIVLFAPLLLIGGIFGIKATIFDSGEAEYEGPDITQNQVNPEPVLAGGPAPGGSQKSESDKARDIKVRVKSMDPEEIFKELKKETVKTALWKTEQLHTEARIAGYIANDEKSVFVVKTPNGRIMKVRGQFCDYNRVVSAPFCIMDNKIVTTFSGTYAGNGRPSRNNVQPEQPKTLELM